MIKQAKQLLTAGICLMLLSGCLRPAGERATGSDDLIPAAGTSEVAVSFGATALQRLAQAVGPEEPLTLAVVVAKQSAGTTSKIWSGTFPLIADNVYVLPGLPLGELEFQFRVVRLDQSAVAEGFKTYKVVAGRQDLGVVTLKLVSGGGSQTVPLEVQITVALAGGDSPLAVAPVDGQPAATPEAAAATSALLATSDQSGGNPDLEPPQQVKDLMQKFLCNQCHSAEEPQGGFDLESIPYRTVDGASAAEVMAKVVAAVEGSTMLMPPFGNRLDSEQVAVMAAYRDALAGTGSGGGEEPTPTPVPEALAAVSITVTAVDGGSMIYEGALALVAGTWVLPENARAQVLPGTKVKVALTGFDAEGANLGAAAAELSLSATGVLSHEFILKPATGEVTVSIEIE